jgi:putative ABC transport system ATP-binding protein
MTIRIAPATGTGPTSPAGPVLEMTNVVKRYGAGATEVRALTNVSITVGRGEFVALMGPSGSGKSTLLHLAGGLERPSAGQVLVEGKDLDHLDAKRLAALRRQSVGFVFQRLNLVPTLTAVENVTLPLELDGVSPKTARAEAIEALERVQIDGPLDRYPDDLSGGQQQRVAIARAIVGNRSLLLADEPTGSLDSVTADLVIELLASLVTDRGCSLVLVTHEARFASWADRIVRVRDGLLTEETMRLAVEGEVAASPR